MSDTTSNPPVLSISMSIDPPQFTRGSETPPTISITATSHASEPITIFTWHTIFNLKLAQQRKNLICIDLTTGRRIQLETTKGPQRLQFSFALDGRDDQFFVALEPETPMTITHRFLRSAAVESDKGFTPGHKYRLEIRENEEAEWWRYGKKEEVIDHASGPSIRLGPIEPVEFEVEG
ncbi:hypothetical protein F53441_10529 [Fusarium austroafricanum]|uniref:Uncharacterized protein n=1 Tax=Fusarium austroafricanum TaxID=2364996 RepID=A0A8H4K6U8_9HYPO|nr:hypothetical protein F53441_10529 [Fusarium austroafricanum]